MPLMQDYGESNRKFDSFMQIDLKYFFSKLECFN